MHFSIQLALDLNLKESVQDHSLCVPFARDAPFAPLLNAHSNWLTQLAFPAHSLVSTIGSTSHPSWL